MLVLLTVERVWVEKGSPRQDRSGSCEVPGQFGREGQGREDDEIKGNLVGSR